jgi:hypothetical protein
MLKIQQFVQSPYCWEDSLDGNLSFYWLAYFYMMIKSAKVVRKQSSQPFLASPKPSSKHEVYELHIFLGTGFCEGEGGHTSHPPKKIIGIFVLSA